MNLKLSDPYVSEFEKNKIREMLDFLKRNLEAAEAELRDAQDKLSKLGSSDGPFAPPEPPRSS